MAFVLLHSHFCFQMTCNFEQLGIFTFGIQPKNNMNLCYQIDNISSFIWSCTAFKLEWPWNWHCRTCFICSKILWTHAWHHVFLVTNEKSMSWTVEFPLRCTRHFGVVNTNTNWILICFWNKVQTKALIVLYLNYC